uniref:Uncharacterized protein n=1 Tax=Meleagris gallopavo TaxID=9103 RepID=A0A803Y1S9_MELGA
MCFTCVGSQLSMSSSKASNFSGPLQLLKKMRHQFLRANSHSHSSMSSRVTFTSKLMHGNYTAVMVRG